MSGSKEISPNANKISVLATKSTEMEIGSAQGSLNLGIEKSGDFGEIGMGVLSDGTPYLNQRGLAVLCGVENAHIGTISSQWNEPELKPRIKKIKSILEQAGFNAPVAHVEIQHSGRVHFCYPISWLCRDSRPSVREGDGRVQINFARRGNMDYEDFRNYLHLLRNADNPDIRIHWPVIDIDGVEAYHQRERYGLQLADIVTSGINASLEPDFYGNVETRYLKTVRNNVYSRKGRFLSYGAKIVPSLDLLADSPSVMEFQQIFAEK